MAKMTELEALQLLTSAASLAAQLAGLIPSRVSNFQAIKDGLASEDADALNAQIVAAHADIQKLDAQLQALRNGGTQ